MFRSLLIASVLLCSLASLTTAQDSTEVINPLVRVVDLDVGDAQDVVLCNGKTVSVKVLDLLERRDKIRNAVRSACVKVEIDGVVIAIESANYRLPQKIGNVQFDCPITKGLTANTSKNAWGLDRDVRLRLWPADSPLIARGTFVYPIKQRWFASSTQMANEPCYVDSAEQPSVRSIYYHYGLDFGGVEGIDEIVAATDGTVVSARNDRLAGHSDSPVRPRYDVVYIRDARGWYYRYSHFYSIDEAIQPGVKVKAGQRLGLLGKEGGSGGWTHLHFDIHCRMPSGRWGCQEAYAFAWQAYLDQYKPKLLAVARPHHVALTGETVELDGSRSYSATGDNLSCRWEFTDETTAECPKVSRTYSTPGYYSEILKVTDKSGRVDYDFAIVHVFDRNNPGRMTHAIHASYYPTFGIGSGDEVTFKVRTFATTDGQEIWDFGDGTPPVTTKSDGNVAKLAKDGYASVKHRYERAGHYLVCVERTDRNGQKATCRLQVRVGK